MTVVDVEIHYSEATRALREAYAWGKQDPRRTTFLDHAVAATRLST
jgi:hypothetical protein